MAPREARRVLALAIVVAVACALGLAWFLRAGGAGPPEERAREKAVELQEKVRELTH